MTKTTKYLLIAGGVVLAYYLYTKSKGTKTTTGTPNTPNTKTCPEGQVLRTVNCITAPCPPICVDAPTVMH